jgi:transposase InsO family protein
MNRWTNAADLPLARLLAWAGVPTSTFHGWRGRYGQANENGGTVPRDHWLDPEEQRAIVRFRDEHPGDGYRRLAFLMIDRDVAYASPATVYRVLRQAGRMRRWATPASKKGRGFDQPERPHAHWHVDISYVNVAGTFFYFIGVLDGWSRYLLHWELRESMTECDVGIVLQRARERFPGQTPRLISDNGRQFIAREFKKYLCLCGMQHARTSPGHPQSNGKLERFHATLKQECLRPMSPLTVEDARRVVARFVDHYNNERLHSAIDYVAPRDKLEDRAPAILEERDRKLEAARERRARRRHELAAALPANP